MEHLPSSKHNQKDTLIMSNKLVYSVKTQNLALKLKLNPIQEQKQFLNKTFGCARFVYNYLLNEKNQFYEKEIKPLGNNKKQETLFGKLLSSLHQSN